MQFAFELPTPKLKVSAIVRDILRQHSRPAPVPIRSVERTKVTEKDGRTEIVADVTIFDGKAAKVCVWAQKHTVVIGARRSTDNLDGPSVDIDAGRSLRARGRPVAPMRAVDGKGKRAMTTARDAKEAGYICGDCADVAGGEWPAGHVATWSEGTCGLCKKQTMRAAWDDWNWPGQDLEEQATITREF